MTIEYTLVQSLQLLLQECLELLIEAQKNKLLKVSLDSLKKQIQLILNKLQQLNIESPIIRLSSRFLEVDDENVCRQIQILQLTKNMEDCKFKSETIRPNDLFATPNRKIGLIQDIMTGLFDLKNMNTTPVVVEEKIKEEEEEKESPEPKEEEDPTPFIRDTTEGTTLDFYECFIRDILRNVNSYILYGKDRVGIYVIVFDKSQHMSVLKINTQLVRSAKSIPFPKDAVLTEEGLIYTSDKERKDGLEFTDARPFNIRQFMISRHLRPAFYAYIYERLKTEPRIAHIHLVLDFGDTPPMSLYQGVLTVEKRWSNRQGEADTALLRWCFLLNKEYTCVLIAKDKDIYLIGMLQHHHCTRDIYTNIYSVVDKKPLHCNLTVCREVFTLMPGFFEALFVIVALSNTDFFLREFIFKWIGTAAIQTACLRHIVVEQNNIWESAASFTKLIRAIENEYQRRRDEGLSKSTRPCLTNPDQLQLNWAYAQLMNFLYYWATLDRTRPPTSPLLQQGTRDALVAWKDYYLCGLPGQMVHPTLLMSPYVKIVKEPKEKKTPKANVVNPLKIPTMSIINPSQKKRKEPTTFKIQPPSPSPRPFTPPHSPPPSSPLMLNFSVNPTETSFLLCDDAIDITVDVENMTDISSSSNSSSIQLKVEEMPPLEFDPLDGWKKKKKMKGMTSLSSSSFIPSLFHPSGSKKNNSPT